MKRYRKILLIIIIIASSAGAVESSLSPNPELCSIPTAESLVKNGPMLQSSEALLAEKLGWLVGPNLCGGFFFEPQYISSVPLPPPINSAQTTITSTGMSTFAQKEPSTLEGNVHVTQPGREVTADKIILYRNEQTGKISTIDLKGDVKFQESGRLLVGESSHIDLEKKTVSISQGAYRIARPSVQGPISGWGVLEHAVREATGNLIFDKGTYTTCSPTDPTWFLKADHLALNKETGRGTARNVWIYGADKPIFYTPYFNFPIDKRRYSGFLYPSVQFDQDSGFVLNIPYYFNLAANYDDTLTLSPMSNRGVQTTNLFRYLTEDSEGTLLTSFIPYDSEFANFKNTAPEQFPSSTTNDPYLDALNNDSNSRGALSFHDATRFSEKWRGALDLNYVTDDYYLQDFGNGPQAISTDQLLNQAEAGYQDEHWQFLGRLQAYQTLHDINDVFVQDQYMRLPQIDLNASYPDQPYGLDYEFNSEWVNFQHVNDFFTDQPVPTGNRVHVNPQIKLPLNSSYGFLTPAIGVDSTTYGVVNNPNTNSDGLITYTDLNTTRTLPIFDIDGGLYFDRNFSLGSHAFKQTLEPRLFYLYVPRVDQNDIPIFDTNLPAFDFNQLFLTNRFVGYDRVGDANQLSWGLTSRFLDGFTGQDKLDASLGKLFTSKIGPFVYTPIAAIVLTIPMLYRPLQACCPIIPTLNGLLLLPQHGTRYKGNGTMLALVCNIVRHRNISLRLDIIMYKMVMC